MNLLSVITDGATSTIMNNPVASAVSRISSLTDGIGDLSNGAIGQIGGAISDVGSMSASVSEYMASELERLKVKLPIMSAVANLEHKAGALSGKLPGTRATSLFASATQGISQLGGVMNSVGDSIGSSMSSVSSVLSDVAGATPQQKLANFAALAPSMKIKDPSDPSGVRLIDNPEYTAFVADHSEKFSGLNGVASNISGACSGAMAALDSIKSGEDAALKAGTSKLKDYAFARFASSPQPVAVQNVLDRFVAKPSHSTYVDSMIIRAASSTQNGVARSVEPREYTQLPPAKPVDARTTPIVGADDASNLSPGNAQSYRQTLDDAAKALFDWKKRVDSKIAPVEQWKRSRNYDQVKSDALANPGDSEKKAAFESLKAELIATDVYRSYDADATAYNAARVRALIDIERYNSALNGLSSNFSTGVELFGALALAVLVSQSGG